MSIARTTAIATAEGAVHQQRIREESQKDDAVATTEHAMCAMLAASYPLTSSSLEIWRAHWTVRSHGGTQPESIVTSEIWGRGGRERWRNSFRRRMDGRMNGRMEE
jgi:hypothetical protein